MTESIVRYRAQVLGVGKRWVDGGLFVRRIDAERDAVRLAALYDKPTRVAEVTNEA